MLLEPRKHETVFRHQSLMEMSETDVKIDRPNTRHSKSIDNLQGVSTPKYVTTSSDVLTSYLLST